MVVESLLFCLREGVPREGLPYIDFLSTSGIPSSAFGAALLQGATHFGLSLFRFHTAAGIHPPLSARPFSKGLLASDYLSFTFIPLRGSILRLRRAPSLRGYSIRTISLSLSHRFEDPSSAFGAPLLQGATRFGLSLFRFHTAAGIHPPPSARPFYKGLPTSGLSHFHFHTATTDLVQAIANVPG